MRSPPTQTQIDAAWAAMPVEAREEILEANLSARMLAQRPDRTYWLTVGHGFSRLNTEAMRLANVNHHWHPRYRTQHRLLLRRVPDLLELFDRDRSSSQYARDMYENWHEVEPWLAETDEMGRLNHPRAIMQKFNAAHKDPTESTGQLPTPVQRQAARVEELTSERDALEQENRRLRRGQDNLLEGQAYTWQDDVKDIARIMLQAYPTKAKELFAEGMRQSQARTSRNARVRRGNQVEEG